MAYLTNAGTVLLVGTADADTLDATASIFFTNLAGGLGNDTYIIDWEFPNDVDLITEEANGGTDTVRSYFGYGLTAFVENLILLGDENLNGLGNNLNNTLTGNAGNNMLNGGAGNDTMAGGLGDDRYTVDSTLDVVSEGVNAGHDKVFATVSYVLGLNVEDLQLDSGALNGTGNAGDNFIDGSGENNVLLGLAGDDLLKGNAGNDRLDGGAGNDRLDGGIGNDTLIGGLGDDTYVISTFPADQIDTIQEAANGGNDTVETDGGHTLAANVENLILIALAEEDDGAMRGNASNNYIQGNDADNFLFGEAGNDTLDGRGGADTMSGGAGNDTYVIDHWQDRVFEAAGAAGGTADKVVVSSLFVQLPDNVEILQMVGYGSFAAYGNASNNIMYGNSGNNFLLAFGGNDILDGGAGADNLQGGAGDDIYYFDNPGDYAQEMRDEGKDTVFTSVSFNFYGAFNIENFTAQGSENINITGNDLANIIIGNAGDNFLNGRGGADDLQGGLGNDTYLVHDAGDIVRENAGAGTDLVISMIAHTLSANVENLLLGNTGGNINGTGNALNNFIEGNGGTNSLSGLGGNDSLYGYGGNDTLDGGAGDDLLNGGGGTDTMAGGAGNDTYVVDRFSDSVTEGANAGTDTVHSTVTWTLGANVENLTLLLNANVNGTGNALNNILVGNDGANALDGGGGADTISGGGDDDVLTGGAGNDTLDGGEGEDTMSGGLGDDIYVVDDDGDTVTELTGEGSDTVRLWTSRGDYDRDELDDDLDDLENNVENIVMMGNDDLMGKGNNLSNVITGNAGNNVLSGAGLGTDRLVGGKGDDLYLVDQATDVISEAANEGVDTVVLEFTPTGTYALGANLEILRLSTRGSANINANGNLLDNGMEGTAGTNQLDGGAGNDYLSGQGGNDILIGGTGNDYLEGGSGADTLRGGAGNDAYEVDGNDSSSEATEDANAGTDTVYSTATTWTLGANFENLALLGSGNINGTGNALDNSLYGNLGDNNVSGGDGNDTFHFHAYEVDMRAWQSVLDIDFVTFSATLDGGDSVNGGEGDDALYAAIFDLAGDALQITGVEAVTLYSGTNGSGENVANAAGVDADRITISNLRPEDDQGASATANITLTNLSTDADIALAGFDGNATFNFTPSVDDDDVVIISLSHFGVDMFSGSQTLTTTGVGTVVLEVLQPADGTGTSARMGASTDVEHVVLTGISGEIRLEMPDGADLTLDHANLNVYLLNHGTGDFPIYLNHAAATFFMQDMDPVASVTLDTGDETSDSFISMVNAGPPDITIFVGGAGNLSMSLAQNLDASEMTGNLNAGTYGLGDNYSLRSGTGNDRLEGGSGNDRLSGGSDGVDELLGNAGSDTFVFDVELSDSHMVYMPDFESGIDKIELDADIFADVAGGVNAGNYFEGDFQEMGSARIAFDPHTGNLYYREGVNTAEEAVAFANVWYGKDLSFDDFTVIA